MKAAAMGKFDSLILVLISAGNEKRKYIRS